MSTHFLEFHPNVPVEERAFTSKILKRCTDDVHQAISASTSHLITVSLPYPMSSISLPLVI